MPRTLRPVPLMKTMRWKAETIFDFGQLRETLHPLYVCEACSWQDTTLAQITCPTTRKDWLLDGPYEARTLMSDDLASVLSLRVPSLLSVMHSGLQACATRAADTSASRRCESDHLEEIHCSASRPPWTAFDESSRKGHRSCSENHIVWVECAERHLPILRTSGGSVLERYICGESA
jgi:hypothetical protein